jgi:hypothetical protein
MDRRGFLGGILATGMAPALVRYSSLMRPRTYAVPLFAGGFATINGVLISPPPTLIRDPLFMFRVRPTWAPTAGAIEASEPLLWRPGPYDFDKLRTVVV